MTKQSKDLEHKIQFTHIIRAPQRKGAYFMDNLGFIVIGVCGF